MREDVADLADRDHVAARRRRQVENGGRGRRDRIIAAIAGAAEIVRRAPRERPGDDAADLITIHQLAGDGAHLVEAREPERRLVRGDLKHAVGRGVADRLSGADVRLAELADDVGARCVAIAENARQIGAAAQRLDELRRKARFRIGEIAPVERHRHAGDFPMAGGGILALRNLAADAPAAAARHAAQSGRQHSG